MLRIPIESREQWLALRQQDVTASTCGCLLGVHPYCTPYGLYLLKSGIVGEDPEETGPMRRGRLLEPVAIELLREQNPLWEIAPPRAYYRDPDLRLGATPDALAVDDAGKLGVVQIKTVEPSVFRRKWMDGGEVDPPLWIVCQAIEEAHLTGAEWAAVAALVVGFGVDLHVVPIPIHDGIVERIKAEVVAFWSRIERREPYPPDYARDGALIARQFEEARVGEIIDLTNDNSLPPLAAEDEKLAAELKASKDRRAAVRSEILAKIGNAEIALFQGGRIFAPTTRRKSYTVKETSFRDLRIKLAENMERTL